MIGRLLHWWLRRFEADSLASIGAIQRTLDRHFKGGQNIVLDLPPYRVLILTYDPAGVERYVETHRELTVAGVEFIVQDLNEVEEVES